MATRKKEAPVEVEVAPVVEETAEYLTFDGTLKDSVGGDTVKTEDLPHLTLNDLQYAASLKG